MAAFEYINSKWQELRKRMTKGLAAAFATSTLMIAACMLLAPGEEGPYVCSVIVTVALTLASSVFAACVISFMFDLKSIRNLIVRNDVNLLLRMLLRSDELFTTDGNSGSQHDVILRNLRLKATSALNGIDLDIDDPKGSSTDLKEGHVLACLSSLDQQLDSAYAKYVNIRRIVRDEGDGSFSIHETTYIRLYNDTETPKTIRAWNYLRSASIPATCSNPQRDTLQEHVTVTVNEGVPKRYDYSYPCEISDLQGIDTASRRWKCQWDEELRATQVPPKGTCVMEIHRTFFIPEKEDISYQWRTLRAESRYEITFEGDSCKPLLQIINCNQCEKANAIGCAECTKGDDIGIICEGNSCIAYLKNWPDLDTQIKVTWV